MRRLADPDIDPLIAVRVFELELSGLERVPAATASLRYLRNAHSAGGEQLLAGGGRRVVSDLRRTLPDAHPISVEALRLLRNLQTRPEDILGA